MEFIDVVSLIIKIQAVFLMTVVAIKLWYVDRTQQKTKLALTFERLMKYTMFKKALFFIMMTFLFGVAAEVVTLWSSRTLEYVFTFLSLGGLMGFAYLLFKISSYTYEHKQGSLFKRALVNTQEVVVPLIGGTITAILIFFSPGLSSSPTGMAVSQAAAGSLLELGILIALLVAVGLIISRTVVK
ncbi:MAG: hypothetical protein KJ709_00640 [Nanoarchaeota archaeon]|nr:hypothetical protein [Nanoarchaeota archaeon]